MNGKSDAVSRIVTSLWNEQFLRKVPQPLPKQVKFIVEQPNINTSLLLDPKAMDELYFQLNLAMRPRKDMIKVAVRYVLSLGYDPTDLRINYENDHGIETDHLFVRDELCFEVRVTRTEFVKGKSTITTEPKLYAWPNKASLDNRYKSSTVFSEE